MAQDVKAKLTAQPELPRLKAIVERLASPEFLGRSGAGGEKSAAYIEREFRRLGLEPMFPGSYVQEIPDRDSKKPLGRNVGAILRGADPKLVDEWVVLGAHFDHLGVHEGVLFPGADDNATGVAMMLETARSLVARGQKPSRSVLFLGFDLEEIGLFGSRYFVAHPAVPLEKIALFVTADMIGRSLAGVCERNVFVIGSEHSPRIRPWIKDASQGESLDVGLMGSDILVLNRSDYGPFRSRNVPFLFFTTGENPRYHSPKDDAASLDYPKFAAISRVMHRIIERAATDPETPKWTSAPDNPLAEAMTIYDVLKQLLKHDERLKIGAAQRFLMNNALKSLEGIIERGVFTSEDRVRIIQVARVVLFTVI